MIVFHKLGSQKSDATYYWCIIKVLEKSDRLFSKLWRVGIFRKTLKPLEVPNGLQRISKGTFNLIAGIKISWTTKWPPNSRTPSKLETQVLYILYLIWTFYLQWCVFIYSMGSNVLQILHYMIFLDLIRGISNSNF